MFTATSGQHRNQHISRDFYTSRLGGRHILRHILKHFLRPLLIPSEKADRCLLFSEELPATQRGGPSLFSEVPSLELATSQAKQNRHILLMLEMHLTRPFFVFGPQESIIRKRQMWASLACLCLIGACLIKTCPQRRKCLEQTCQLIKLWGLAIAQQIIVQSKFWSKFTVFALVTSPSRSPHLHSQHKTWIYELKSHPFQMIHESNYKSLV